MRRFLSTALILIALPALAQTTSYFNQGFLRQPDAATDRAYLGITGGGGNTNLVANFFTTNNVTPFSLTNGFIDAVYGNAHYYPLAGNPSGFLTSNQPITLTGDVTGGPASTSIATTLKNTGTAGTYTKTTFNAKGLETSGAAAVLASADYANQGTATTVLHGNAAGNPSWGSVNLGTDVTGSLPPGSVGASGAFLTNGNSFVITISNKFNIETNRQALYVGTNSINGTNTVQFDAANKDHALEVSTNGVVNASGMVMNNGNLYVGNSASIQNYLYVYGGIAGISSYNDSYFYLITLVDGANAFNELYNGIYFLQARGAKMYLRTDNSYTVPDICIDTTHLVGIGGITVPKFALDVAGTVSISSIVSATNGVFFVQGTNTAPTAAFIGGTVGSKTNHLLKCVGGGLIDYWSDGTTLWSKQLAP